MEFKPTYLYVKEHKKTGLKYFGKTVCKNPHTYTGSGKRWLNHLNYHGNDVNTIIIGYFNEPTECKEVALLFSKENNIVDSSDWANLEIEDGTQGGIGVFGKKNGSYGTRWITNEVVNKKIKSTEDVPSGWRYGMVRSPGWGENLSKKLKGRTQIELLGEKRASEIRKLKSEVAKKHKFGRNK